LGDVVLSLTYYHNVRDTIGQIAHGSFSILPEWCRLSVSVRHSVIQQMDMSGERAAVWSF